jgi:hypothetical protein
MSCGAGRREAQRVTATDENGVRKWWYKLNLVGGLEHELLFLHILGMS